METTSKSSERKETMVPHYLAIFMVSLLCISLELFLTRILNLKAWNHLVYVIIPFAILGYGIGANLCLIFRNYFLTKWRSESLIAVCLVLTAISAAVSPLLLVKLPINVAYLVNILVSLKSVGMLLLAYTILMVPFVIIGFLVVYLFLENPQANHKLYFFDLAGAGCGAIAFYPLINSLQVIHSILFLCLVTVGCAILIGAGRRRVLGTGALIAVGALAFLLIPEPTKYTIDRTKGWEYIPGSYTKDQYDHIVSRWHPMGRTDIFRMTDPLAAEQIYNNAVGTFEINIKPRPEFSYISTNFLAGTPIYNLSKEGLADSRIIPFTQAMEFPYTVAGKDKVLVIGAGGGRDIFMAKTHGVKEVLGAEINPGVYAEMAPGGTMHKYSGGVYVLDGTQIDNVDGRQLVKRQPSQIIDLIILNGVDTFSGLSTGAYAYAESYLYTKDALVDYLRVLKNDGLINFNRWFDPIPREDLRLFAIALEGLRTIGAQNPGNHIIIGGHGLWALILIKKTPFSTEEREKIYNYFGSHETQLIYPVGEGVPQEIRGPSDFYNLYLANFNENRVEFFNQAYLFDVSVVTDDNPFFYKYYKLSEFHPLKVFSYHHTGTVIFMTQALILIQALIFILIFILLPLFLFRKAGLRAMPAQATRAFVLFFACLGVGFMFIEIPLMQRFVLLLGSPIHALSVTLSILLIATGIGSLLLPEIQTRLGNPRDAVAIVGILVAVAIGAFALTSVGSLDRFVGWSFAGRVAVVGAILLPLGILLGVFFPSGLTLISRDYPEAIIWAWGINSGFSVLGSIIAIILAQFLGFHTILLLGGIIYLIAILAFRQLHDTLAK